MSYTDQFIGYLVTTRPFKLPHQHTECACVWVVDIAIEKMMGKI